MVRSKQYRNFKVSKPMRYLGVVLLTTIALATLTTLFLILAGEKSSTSILTDNLLCALYVALYVALMAIANDKVAYAKRNWWLLLAGIPIESIVTNSNKAMFLISALYIIRFAIRITILVRISRLLNPKNYALEVFTVLGSIIFISTALFYNAEHVLNPQVNTYFDSFYWSIVTGTTVGYGDIVPVTTAGRIVAIFMMVIGIGIFGLVTGTVASWFNKRAKTRYEKIETRRENLNS